MLSARALRANSRRGSEVPACPRRCFAFTLPSLRFSSSLCRLLFLSRRFPSLRRALLPALLLALLPEFLFAAQRCLARIVPLHGIPSRLSHVTVLAAQLHLRALRENARPCTATAYS